jgi:putative SOS response-associated peptidase YedK
MTRRPSRRQQAVDAADKLDGSMWRGSFKRRRCLILADGFYVWKTGARGKQPYYCRMRDHAIFAFAGLWEHWEGEDGQVIESCTIIVTDANELLRSIHDRMPVILDEGHYSQWLDMENIDARRARQLLTPYPGDRLEIYPVSTRVNSPAHDEESCIAPLDK